MPRPRTPLTALLLILTLAAVARLQAQAPDSAEARQEAVAFLDLLVAGQVDSAWVRFDDNMRNVLSAEKLEATWQTVLNSAGAFQQVDSTSFQRSGPFRVVTLLAAFEQVRADIRVALDDQDRVSGLYFLPHREHPAETWEPASYVDTAAFREVPVMIGAGDDTLPGTLSVPRGDGPFPALVLVHGSGPQDRDETIGPNKPFRDLAWGLASRGVAVLRYEKRTKVYPAQFSAAAGGFTVEQETIRDAVGAVALLREQPGIKPRHVFLLGHSLGGMLAPRIALRAPGLAGLIILAGTTRQLDLVILDQINYIASIQGDSLPAAQQAALDKVRTEAARVRELKPGDSASTAPVLGAPPSYWLDLRRYDPAATARKVHVPMLILQGGRDYQVTEQDFDGWRKALDGRKDVTFHLFPSLNHLFIAGEGRIAPEEYSRPGHVDPEVVEQVAGWIAGH